MVDEDDACFVRDQHAKVRRKVCFYVIQGSRGG